MNIIQQQAKDFFRRYDETGNYDEFIELVKSYLFKYRKVAHRLEFIDYIMVLLKNGYDEHLLRCEHPNEREKCQVNYNYENSLFFLQNEKEELLENLTPNDFSVSEKAETNKNLEQILDELKLVRLGQELTYDDFQKEFDELKQFYYLNKKTWSQLLFGKLTEMVAGGIISETISKQIVEAVSKHYEGIIQ
jgi:hypothetical protein